MDFYKSSLSFVYVSDLLLRRHKTVAQKLILIYLIQFQAFKKYTNQSTNQSEIDKWVYKIR